VAPPADVQTRQRVAELSRAIDRALTRDETGDSEGAHAEAAALVAEARALGYEPLVAEALQVLAATEQGLRKLDDAELHLNEALAVASAVKDHARVANVSVAKLYFFGAIKQDFASALALVDPARAAVLQAGGSGRQLGDLHMNAGVVYDLAGKRDEAEIELNKALELFREHDGAETPRMGMVLHNLGALAMDRGDRDKSRELFEQTVALRERVLGKDHPEIGNTLLGLGALARRDNRLDDARAHYVRAAELFERAYGPGHAQLGAVYNNLAIVETVSNEHAAAEAYHRKAMQIRIEAYGDSHPLVAQSLGGLANVISSQGRHTEALEYATRSMELRAKVYPEGHTGLAIGKHNLASVLSALSRHDEAVAHRNTAIEILEKAKLDPADMAEVRFAQATDLWAIDRRRDAEKLARLARDGYAAAGESEAKRLAEVEAWLAGDRDTALAERPATR
jgi:tetratricopeptide (TPR) repeat protein